MKKQELNYYDEFIKNIEIAYQISNILKEYIDKFKTEDSEEIEQKVHKLENDADYNLHNLKNYLVKDFLPPIEREDIVLLANKIDDIIDYLDEITINFNILDIKAVRGDFKDFVEIINQLSVLLKEILEKFKDKKNYDKIGEYIININNIEEDGDKIYENSIKNLYKNESNPIEIIKWNTIYNTLENCIDSYESVANTIGEIVLKNT